jgi:hypothetical protein
MRRGAGQRLVFSRETGPAGDAASGCAILRAMQAFQSLKLIFLQLDLRHAEKSAKAKTGTDGDLAHIHIKQ